ncbi:MAG: SDR family oxidoreductase [Caldilineales bacterium]|nr:SDR family oxidoreductase [Caldilineales bacterium]
MHEQSLAGKAAIVTGAGRGIGRTIALTLAEAGAQVALAARSGEELRSVQSEIEVKGGRAIAVTVDVSEEASVKEMVGTALAAFGRLDIVVNNAGVGVFQPLLETSVAEWDWVMAVNCRGSFLVCRETIPHLRLQPTSYIINIASAVAYRGYANQAAYGASKHALVGMSKALAQELRETGIRVHVVSPGGVDTEMIAQARPDIEADALMHPQDVADIVLFLVTRQGNAVIDQIRVRRAKAKPWD